MNNLSLSFEGLGTPFAVHTRVRGSSLDLRPSPLFPINLRPVRRLVPNAALEADRDGLLQEAHPMGAQDIDLYLRAGMLAAQSRPRGSREGWRPARETVKDMSLTLGGRGQVDPMTRRRTEESQETGLGGRSRVFLEKTLADRHPGRTAAVLG